MKLIRKHISKIFILTAGIIIFAHAVIPHHHHFECIEEQGDTGYMTVNSDMHNQHPVIHCHAFSHIISQNGNNLSKHLISFSFFDSGFLGFNKNISIGPTINSLISTHSFIFPPQKRIILTSNSLRAPPANFYS